MSKAEIARGRSPRAAQRSLVGAGLALACSFWAPLGLAETGVDTASTTAKGTVAGALLGAEAVVLTEAAFGVKPGWAYLLGAGVGAAGGGVGGYFLEDSMSPKLASLLLAGGLVLAIPATVAALSASAYSPPADYIQDTPPSDEPVETPPRASSRPAPGSERLALRAPLPALVGSDEGTWTWGVPAVELLDVYSVEMRRAYNLQSETELRVPVLAMRF